MFFMGLFPTSQEHEFELARLEGELGLRDSSRIRAWVIYHDSQRMIDWGPRAEGR